MKPDDRHLIPLDQLIALPDLQIRARTNPALVRKYALAIKHGATFPPLVAAELDGSLYLVDGFHRLEAMRQEGMYDALAEVVSVKDLEEARWIAARSNLRHGAPLKSRELRPVFQAYVQADQHKQAGRHGSFKSYREISADLGGLVSHSTVYNWMHADFPSIARAIGGSEGSAPGGLVPVLSPDQICLREAVAALAQLESVIGQISNAQTRYYLHERALAVATALELTGLEQPDF